VVILAATNCPWDLDPAILRRLEKRIYIPLPDLEARVELISLLVRNIAIGDDVNVATLAELSEGYSGSDLHTALREASMMPMRRLLETFSPEQIVMMKEQGHITMPRVSSSL
jgi:katanin p60 ATPase-containing subunit A1